VSLLPLIATASSSNFQVRGIQLTLVPGQLNVLAIQDVTEGLNDIDATSELISILGGICFSSPPNPETLGAAQSGRGFKCITGKRLNSYPAPFTSAIRLWVVVDCIITLGSHMYMQLESDATIGGLIQIQPLPLNAAPQAGNG
jgi:hypothetical protein